MFRNTALLILLVIFTPIPLLINANGTNASAVNATSLVNKPRLTEPINLPIFKKASKAAVVATTFVCDKPMTEKYKIRGGPPACTIVLLMPELADITKAPNLLFKKVSFTFLNQILLMANTMQMMAIITRKWSGLAKSSMTLAITIPISAPGISERSNCASHFFQKLRTVITSAIISSGSINAIASTALNFSMSRGTAKTPSAPAKADLDIPISNTTNAMRNTADVSMLICTYSAIDSYSAGKSNHSASSDVFAFMFNAVFGSTANASPSANVCSFTVMLPLIM